MCVRVRVCACGGGGGEQLSFALFESLSIVATTITAQALGPLHYHSCCSQDTSIMIILI